MKWKGHCDFYKCCQINDFWILLGYKCDMFSLQFFIEPLHTICRLLDSMKITIGSSICRLGDGMEFLNLPPSLIVFCPHLNQLKSTVGMVSVFPMFSEHTTQETTSTVWDIQHFVPYDLWHKKQCHP